ncbi:hypothetical protein F0562_001981 [Nyssa sinensis]|uniref:Glabrous enhancer-binding protein-like DBD domain-containing protein n=1 Tax=Nyssa sinensis TaxID=561372 RepID=A0A5J5C8J5_9ASTE|nr:hypothetical protein F0562_001981 [Nyssa sinensis]
MSTFTSDVSTSSKRRRKPSSSATTPPAENLHKSPVASPEKQTITNPKSQRHRLFTEEDEIRLLKAFLRTTKSTKSSTTPLSSLIGGQFSDSQITDKLRRLRQRYHKLARTKSFIKTPHDRQIYEIAGKIWGKKATNSSSPDRNPGESTENPKNIEENGAYGEVGLENFPVLRREVDRIFPENAVYREGLKFLGRSKLRGLNEKWMEQRMEEAGLAAKRAQLNYEQSKNLKLF